MRYLAACAIVVGCGGGSQPPVGDDAAGPGVADAATSDAAIADAPVDSVVLKVATFNVLHGFPLFENLEQRTQIVVDWITAEQPDLVTIQEAAQTSTMPNRGGLIAERTGYHWAWTVAAGVPGVFEEGPGVLSRAPMVASAGIMLPHVVNTFGVRSATRAEIDTPVGRVAMVSAHLGGDSPPDVVINADQAMAAHGFLMEADATAHLLGGDMNADSDEPGMGYLRTQLDDAWMVANPDDPGFTSETPTPTHRIDYVYVEHTVEVVGCELIFAAPVGGIYASDHVGVACSIRIAR
jgi:endonuclease/exonuclease/phosphatase family metal-dependent hydrolase